MRARTRLVAAATSVSLLAALGSAACTPREQAEEPAQDVTQEEPAADAGEREEFVSTAMVVDLGGDAPLFVDQDTGSAYYPTLPEGAPELAVGNVVRVTGNGIMLESLPGQYPGITSIEVIEEGSPADADRYADLVSALCHPRDPAEPPIASAQYETESAAVSFAPTRVAYEWGYGPEETRKTSASHDDRGVGDYAADELIDMRVDGPTKVTVSFDIEATGVSVACYDEADLTAASVAVDDLAFGGGAATFTVEPGHRYAVVASFDDGTATYAFTVR